MRRVLKLCIVFAVLLALAAALRPLVQRSQRAEFIPAPGTYNVEILRDVWGVPHVFGKTDADAAYGLAYAHCEDDAENMEDALLVARHRIASKLGQEQAKIDYINQLFRVRQFVAEKYEHDLPADVRAVADAYAAGATHYAALHPDKMPLVELPITGQDLVAGFTLKAPFFYELQKHLEAILAVAPADPKTATLIPTENPYTDGREIGSNAFAVGPARSSDGATRIAINSHQPWDGQVAWYEAHVHSEEGWNMAGGTFPGGPLIFSGHDENKAWAHTVNRPDLSDTYELEMNPDNPNQYKFDGAWRDLEIDYARITVKLWWKFRWTVKREILWCAYGPALRTDHGVFAIRFAGLGDVRALEQWYRMNKAKDLPEFQAAMALQGIPSFNTLYADKTGNLYYAYNGKFPVRNPNYDWKKNVPGNTSETLWTDFLPFIRVPQVLNPPSAMIQSCNSSPFHTTVGEGNPLPEDFPAWMGVETVMTNRALRALDLYGGDAQITPEEFRAYKFDKHYALDSNAGQRWQEYAALPAPEDPLLREALALVQAWDRQTNADNRNAAIGVLACQPRMLNDTAPVDPDPLRRLRTAADTMMERFGRLDVPWGDTMRLIRGDVDLPLGGAADCLRVVRGELQPDGRTRANYGDGYFMFVEWDAAGKLHTESIHQYGAASTDTASPHYADQAPLFAREEMKPVWMDEANIRQNLARAYRPGDFTGPWYAQP